MLVYLNTNRSRLYLDIMLKMKLHSCSNMQKNRVQPVTVKKIASGLISKFQLAAFLAAAVTLSSLLLSADALAQTTEKSKTEKVNLYTTREPKLIKPLIEAFTEKSGIHVNTVYLKDGMLERLKAEQQHSPADLLMTVDIGQLADLAESGAFQPVESKLLDQAIPAHLRSPKGLWYALSLRDRVLYASPSLNLKSFTYEELADPRWKGKVCIRSGQHPYNIALISSMIAHHGAEFTETWLRQVKANLARPATGGDRDVARDIVGGICELGLANAYYAGQMKTAATGTDARKWGDGIQVIRATFEKSGGNFVNVSGAGVAKYAPNKLNAIAFLEFLTSEQGQQLFVKADFEHPVRAGISPEPIVESFGPFKPDNLDLQTIASFRKQASDLVDKVRFNEK